MSLHIWTGTWADVLLFFVYCFLFGWFFTLGQRVGNKLP
jgi:hypothetical protein